MPITLSEDFIARLDAHMKKEDARDDAGNIERRGWHVGREIPIAMIVAIGIQTIGVIWWAATISARLDYIERTNAAAVAAQALTDKRQDADMRESDSRISAQLEKLDRKIDRLIETRK